MACSRAAVSVLGWNYGNDIVVIVHVVLVSGSTEKSVW
jgi:hypothetical protein